ncbi:unnamed protein product [Lasius platythorax]|uniref:Uncharacterized protein n=1 Tax=Lasius platythorax TaxID=488582 RepID=A0AAV2P3S4_9HYME
MSSSTSTYTYTSSLLPVWSPRSFFSPPFPPCDLDSAEVYLVGVNLTKAKSGAPAKNNALTGQVALLMEYW